MLNPGISGTQPEVRERSVEDCLDFIDDVIKGFELVWN